MSVKASLNGPNRRKKKNNIIDISENVNDDSISFYIRGVDDLFDDDDNVNQSSISDWRDVENSCFFNPHGRAGKALLQKHLQITGMYLVFVYKITFNDHLHVYFMNDHVSIPLQTYFKLTFHSSVVLPFAKFVFNFIIFS